MNAPLPHWPRLLSVELASAYLGISRTTFLGQADGTVWPKPIRHGKRVLWCRKALDQAVDALASTGALSPTEEAPDNSWDDVLCRTSKQSGPTPISAAAGATEKAGNTPTESRSAAPTRRNSPNGSPQPSARPPKGRGLQLVRSAP